MKTHQPPQQNKTVRSSELFFGILMLIIIFLTSAPSANAAPKISIDSIHMEESNMETNHIEWKISGQSEGRVQQTENSASVPLLIMILLAFSYGALSGGLYLVQEIKK